MLQQRAAILRDIHDSKLSANKPHSKLINGRLAKEFVKDSHLIAAINEENGIEVVQEEYCTTVAQTSALHEDVVDNDSSLIKLLDENNEQTNVIVPSVSESLQDVVDSGEQSSEEISTISNFKKKRAKKVDKLHNS